MRFFSFCFVVFFLFSWGLGNSCLGLESGKKVLIATAKSDFKDEVVSLVCNSLKKDIGVEVVVKPLKGLKKIVVADYEAIVIINSCWAWSLNRHVSWFLKQISSKDKDKVFLITTAGDEKWESKDNTIDAITCASKMENTKQAAKDILGEVKNRIDLI